MIFEIKSILKNKISIIIFFICLTLNMVQVPKYMGNTYNVEQNMNVFENQIRQYQEILGNVKLQMQAMQNLDEKEKEYWDNYCNYIEWSIQNAKNGWALFNMHGKTIFEKSKLLKKYNEITLWDKLYHLDSLYLKGDTQFIKSASELGITEPDVIFDKTKIYIIGAQISQNKKEDFNSSVLMVKEQIHQLETKKKPFLGKGPWSFLSNQLRIQSQFSYLFLPLCFVYSSVILLDEKKSRIYRLNKLNSNNYFIRMQIKLFISFIFIVLLSLMIPFILLSISNGLSGYDTWILADTHNWLSFKMNVHTDNYIINNLSEYYATENGFIPNLEFVPLWKSLLLCMPISLLKILFGVNIGVLCSFISDMEGKSYCVVLISNVLYIISQKMKYLLFYNPFAIDASLSVVSGCGKMSWINAIIILFGGIAILEFINYVLLKRKDVT